jgi:type IV pilus assembly protein PilO
MKFSLRGVLFVLVMFGVMAGFYFLFFAKANVRRAELVKQIEERQRALSDLDRSTAGVDDVNHKIAELQQAIQFFESKLPQEKEVDTILKEVWQIAEANALQTKTIKTGKQTRSANYSEQAIEMNLSGDFNGFYTFLQQLEKLPRLTRVMQMALTKITDRDGEMNAQLTLSIFFEPATGPARTPAMAPVASGR